MLQAIRKAPLRAFLPAPDTRFVEEPGLRYLITPSRRDAAYNGVDHFVVDPERADAELDRLIAKYEKRRLPHKWIVGPGSAPPDLIERLRARGLRCWWARGMALRADVDMRPSTRAIVRQVACDDIEDLCETIARGWDQSVDDARRYLYRQLSAHADTHLWFVAYVAGRPAGAAGLTLISDYGYLAAAVVLEESRGLGVYRALVAARLAALAARGHTLATTQAREHTSAPMLEHMGFETIYRFQLAATEDAAPPEAE